MEKITFIEIQSQFSDESETFAIIDRGNGEYTSMPKAVWDEQQKTAEQSGTLTNQGGN